MKDICLRTNCFQIIEAAQRLVFFPAGITMPLLLPLRFFFFSGLGAGADDEAAGELSGFWMFLMFMRCTRTRLASDSSLEESLVDGGAGLRLMLGLRCVAGCLFTLGVMIARVDEELVAGAPFASGLIFLPLTSSCSLFLARFLLRGATAGVAGATTSGPGSGWAGVASDSLLERGFFLAIALGTMTDSKSESVITGRTVLTSYT